MNQINVYTQCVNESELWQYLILSTDATSFYGFSQSDMADLYVTAQIIETQFKERNYTLDIDQLLTDAGYHLEELVNLGYCNWLGRGPDRCSEGFFHKTVTQNGNCYTFNGLHKADTRQVQQELPGPGNGLLLSLFLDSQGYSGTYVALFCVGLFVFYVSC